MFNKTYYRLQAKKAGWLGVMLATTAFCIMQAPTIPVYAAGAIAGTSYLFLSTLLPKSLVGVFNIAIIYMVANTPFTMPFFAGYLGLLGFTLLTNFNMIKLLLNKRDMDGREKEDVKLIDKLQTKTGITVHERLVIDVDGVAVGPNASANHNIVSNTISAYSNLLSALTSKEKKAVFAHEFGHLHNRDIYTMIATNVMFWTCAILAASTLSLPIAGLVLLTNQVAHYGVSQNMELLADLFSAQYANPKDQISSLQKLKQQAKEISKAQPDTITKRAQKGIFYMQKKAGLISHPTNKVRFEYLRAYDVEKAASKVRPN